MTIAIEQLSLPELKSFLREQAQDAFPLLRDEDKLNVLAEKWQSHAEFCTCRLDNRLVGMVAFYANQPDVRVAYISHVYVSKDLRGRSLFSKMLRCIKNEIRPKGFTVIRLEVNANNYSAQEAYVRNGFRVVGNENGTSDKIVMQLNL